MKRFLLILTLYIITLFFCFGQQAGFEGVLEYTIVFKYEQGFREKILMGLKSLGSNDKKLQFFQADSVRFRTYIKQDSIWEEAYLNDEKEIHKINFQAGFHAEVIDHYSGGRTMISNLKALEESLEKNASDPNWRDKIKVSELFNLDYSKLKKLRGSKEIIGGYLSQEYELPFSTPPNSTPYRYWITEELPSDESQQLPYFFNSIFTPKGVILKSEMNAKGIQNHKSIHKITPGPIDPILPRLRSINFGTLDSVQYADQKLNQHLVGKNIELAPTLPDFSFYSVDNNQLESLYSRQNGKFILIDFWATWCAPCLREMPQLAAFQAENAALLEVISLNQGDHRADHVKQMITQHNMTWTQGYAGKVLRAFLNPGKSIPHAILLDSNMRVRWRGNPAGNWDKLAEIIRGN